MSSFSSAGKYSLDLENERSRFWSEAPAYCSTVGYFNMLPWTDVIDVEGLL